MGDVGSNVGMRKHHWLVTLSLVPVLAFYCFTFWRDWYALSGFTFLTFWFLFGGFMVEWTLERWKIPKLTTLTPGTWGYRLRKVEIALGRLMVGFLVFTSLLLLPVVVFIYAYLL